MQFGLRAGITEPITFRCNQVDPDSGEISAVDLTGVASAELRLRLRDVGTLKSFLSTVLPTPQVVITGAAAGEVTYYHATGDLVEGVWDCWIRIVDGVGRTTSFPSDENGQLDVIGSY